MDFETRTLALLVNIREWHDCILWLKAGLPDPFGPHDDEDDDDDDGGPPKVGIPQRVRKHDKPKSQRAAEAARLRQWREERSAVAAAAVLAVMGLGATYGFVQGWKTVSRMEAVVVRNRARPRAGAGVKRGGMKGGAVNWVDMLTAKLGEVQRRKLRQGAPWRAPSGGEPVWPWSWRFEPGFYYTVREGRQTPEYRYYDAAGELAEASWSQYWPPGYKGVTYDPRDGAYRQGSSSVAGPELGAKETYVEPGKPAPSGRRLIPRIGG